MSVCQREFLRLGLAGAFSFPDRADRPMTINLDTEIVATAFDPASDTCAYTIARDGKRWTVPVPTAHLDAHGARKDARRAHLANVLKRRHERRAGGA
jgi:hypothetical protein